MHACICAYTFASHTHTQYMLTAVSRPVASMVHSSLEEWRNTDGVVWSLSRSFSSIPHLPLWDLRDLRANDALLQKEENGLGVRSSQIIGTRNQSVLLQRNFKKF